LIKISLGCAQHFEMSTEVPELKVLLTAQLLQSHLLYEWCMFLVSVKLLLLFFFPQVGRMRLLNLVDMVMLVNSQEL